jgi:hypothetical protein
VFEGRLSSFPSDIRKLIHILECWEAAGFEELVGRHLLHRRGDRAAGQDDSGTLYRDAPKPRIRFASQSWMVVK